MEGGMFTSFKLSSLKLLAYPNFNYDLYDSFIYTKKSYYLYIFKAIHTLYMINVCTYVPSYFV